MKTVSMSVTAWLAVLALVACQGDDVEAPAAQAATTEEAAAKQQAAETTSATQAPARPASGEIKTEPVAPAPPADSAKHTSMEMVPVPQELYPVDPAPVAPPER